MRKNIKIQGDLDIVLRKYTRLISPILGIQGKNKMCDTLATLIKYYLSYSELKDEKVRWTMVFHYDNKIKMCEELNIKMNSFHFLLTKLRAKKIVKNNEVIPQVIPIIENNKFDLTFNFNVDHTTN